MIYKSSFHISFTIPFYVLFISCCKRTCFTKEAGFGSPGLVVLLFAIILPSHSFISNILKVLHGAVKFEFAP